MFPKKTLHCRADDLIDRMQFQQECIPVRCMLAAALTIVPLVCIPSLHTLPCTAPRTCGQTDACENITFPCGR